MNITGSHFAYFTTQTFLFSLIGQVLYLLVSIITARTLGPAGKGTVAVLVLYPTLLFTLGHMSIHRALTVHVGLKKYPSGDYPGTAASFVAAASVFLGLVFLAVYLAFNELFIRNIQPFALLAVLGILPCLNLVQVFSSILQANGKLTEWNLTEFSRVVTLLLAMAIALLIFHMGVTGAVFSYFISNFFGFLMVIYFVRKIPPQRWRFNFCLFKELISDGAKLHIAVIANFIFLRIDMLLLAYYRQTADAGFYSIAVSVADMLVIIPVAIQAVFYSNVSEMINDRIELRRKTIKVYKYGLFLLLTASLMLALLGRTIIAIFYGPGFLASSTPFLILLPGVFYLWSNSILACYLIAMRRFLAVSIIYVIGSGFNVYLNVLLIPPYGAAGAAWASTATYLVIGSLTIFAFFRVSGCSPNDFLKGLAFDRSDIMLYKVWITNSIKQFRH